MAIRVGINGFGRIGRNVLRAGWDRGDVEFVAVNDITDAPTLAHLLKYDSVHGRMRHDVSVDGDALLIDGRRVRVFSEREPREIPSGPLDVGVVLECSGRFTARAAAAVRCAGDESDWWLVGEGLGMVR